MTKFGNGTFKYISGWHDPSTLSGNVTATYDGNTKNAQLVISHGCRPFTEGAWCSPGFWKNAAVEPSAKGPGAYALVGKSPTDLFDGFVYDTWFGNSLPASPSEPCSMTRRPTAARRLRELRATHSTRSTPRVPL
jgi:hypothetical protein